MNSYIILGLVGGLPLLLAIIFSVSSIYYFISVAAGLLLAQYVSTDTALALNTFFSHQNFGSYVSLGLLLLPVALTIFFLRKTLSRSKMILHFVPLVLTSVALSTFIISYLPGGVRHQLLATQIGHTADSSQNALVGAACVVMLLFLWLTKRHKEEKKKKHR